MDVRLPLLVLALIVVAPEAPAGGKGGSEGSVSVRGHVRKDGTYVPPHFRSAPDGNFQNNWSTVGNNNPYTGEDGTVVSPYNKMLGSSSGYVPPKYEPASIAAPITPSTSRAGNASIPSLPSVPSTLAPDTLTPFATTGSALTARPPTKVDCISAPTASSLPARQLSYLAQQKVRDVERAQFWRARGHSFDSQYMTAYSMDQKVKDIERARFWKAKGHGFNPDYMTAYSMDQKVVDIERAQYWQTLGYSFNPNYLTAYSMDQKVKDIERAKFWRERGLTFDANYTTAYSMDREAERIGVRAR